MPMAASRRRVSIAESPIFRLTRTRERGLDSALIGFGLDDDQAHGPNEKFEERCFQQGLPSHARLLGKLAK